MPKLFFLREFKALKLPLWSSLVLVLMLFTSFSFGQSDEGKAESRRNISQVSDPLESINRVMWDFNYDVLDTYIYRPVTQTYVDVVPTPGRKAINNFASNFTEPATVVNNLIQLNFKSSLQALFRFSVNSTFGLLGFLDVADKLGVPRDKETFSNVLGHWSVPSGPYLMIPVVGPMSSRKLVGSIVDGLYFPFTYLSFSEELGIDVLDALDTRESLLGQEVFIEQSLDPYLFVRDAYSQNEAFKVYGNESKVEAPLSAPSGLPEENFNLDDFMDEID